MSLRRRHRLRLSALLVIAVAAAGLGAAVPPASGTPSWRFIDDQVAAHPGLTGSHILERGEDSLFARAWVVDNARRSIDAQYFIWTQDNIGLLASASLLRAAQRGVRVRLIVDDLLLDASDPSLLALARHPNIDIRIYNPLHNVGTPLHQRLLNLLTDFRAANQRMHDKALIVDATVAITGGRNMADEYFDYDQAYNFRDRDALVIGAVVPTMRASFERFWVSPLSVPVETLQARVGPRRKPVTLGAADVQRIYRGFAAHAADSSNFEPRARAAIAAMPTALPALATQLVWSRVDFLSDLPGKNDGTAGIARGGGLTTSALAALAEGARSELLIQSPYLVLSDPAIALLGRLRSRGVRVRISTNSLSSTDNLQAFSGYRSQREGLLNLGLEIHEYRPDPAVQREVMQRHAALRVATPVFALHAKTLVVDRRIVYVGTYNLDPRSENLNTEVGVVIHDARQAGRVAAALLADMRADNSWDAARDQADRFAPFGKRAQVWMWQQLPIRPLL